MKLTLVLTCLSFLFFSGLSFAAPTAEQAVRAFDRMDKTALVEGSPVQQMRLMDIVQNVRSYKVRISGGRCENSLHCPGSSVCLSGYCTGYGGGGDRCENSLHCDGSSVCLSGRCTASSDGEDSGGNRCETSLHCSGSSVCLSGRCTASGNEDNTGQRCENSLHCSGSSVCLSGRCT